MYLDLLRGKDYANKTGGGVELRIHLDALAGLAEHPGELKGYGPVVADVARQVVQQQQPPSGGGRSPTRSPANPSTTGPLGVDPPQANAETLKLAIRLASSPGVARQPSTATSTTGPDG